MIGTYGSAIVICIVSVLLGRAVCVLAGNRGDTWISPAVGFAVVIALCFACVHLPGHGYTAAVILLVACVLSVWPVGRRREWPAPLTGLAVAVAVLAITTVPFLSNARVGVLGISILNDTHWHLFLAQALNDPSIAHLLNYGGGYPLGPHAVAAVFAQGLGTSVDHTLTGLLIATPVLTGLTALGALEDLGPARAWLAATLTAIPYLSAAWYVQSAFKEPILSLLLLGMVVAVQQGRRDRFRRPAATAIPVVLLLVGLLYEYSYPGLLWPIVMFVCWVALEVVFGGGIRMVRTIVSGVRQRIVPLAGAVAIGVVAILPTLNRIYDFWQSSGGSGAGTQGGITGSSLGNLAGPLPTIEGFDIWRWGDWRFEGPHTNAQHLLAIFALIVLVFALVQALRRRDLPWVGAVAGMVVIYVYAKHAQSPYVAAKALVIPAPILVMGSGGELLRSLGDRPVRILRRAREATWPALAVLVGAAVAAVFFVTSFGSDLLVLRDAQVGPASHHRQLRSLRSLLHGKPTLALFVDDYFQWDLQPDPVSSPVYPSPTVVFPNPVKSWAYGQPLDFASVPYQQLDRFAYVITPRTLDQSVVPPNFHVIGHSRDYEVWKRTGPTPAFSVLPGASGRPGVRLNCASAAGRAVSRIRGVAAVQAPPRPTVVPPLVPGQSTTVSLRLPRGRWNLSMPYTSDQAVTVTAPGLTTTLPANLDRPGNPWPVGNVTSDGTPMVVTFKMHDPAVLSTGSPFSQFFSPEPLEAVRIGSQRLVSLARACGRYVDWYRTG